jgi:hypothetical protein
MTLNINTRDRDISGLFEKKEKCIKENSHGKVGADIALLANPLNSRDRNTRDWRDSSFTSVQT